MTDPKPPVFILVTHLDGCWQVGPGYRLGADCYHSQRRPPLTVYDAAHARRLVAEWQQATGLKKVVGARLLKEGAQ